MTGQQIVDNCRDIAARQYEGDESGARQCEIDLLRTKVLELSKKLEVAEHELDGCGLMLGELQELRV